MHPWASMANCVFSVWTLTPVPHPNHPLFPHPHPAQLSSAHSMGQTAGPLISSFGADQWQRWQEPQLRLWSKRGSNKTPFLNDGLRANNPPGKWVREVGDLGGCGGGVVRPSLREGVVWVLGVPAGGPAEQIAGNKAGLQRDETHRGPAIQARGLRPDQTRLDFRSKISMRTVSFFLRWCKGHVWWAHIPERTLVQNMWTHAQTQKRMHSHIKCLHAGLFCMYRNTYTPSTVSPWIHRVSAPLLSLMFDTKALCLSGPDSKTLLSPSYWSTLGCSSTGDPLFSTDCTALQTP